MTRLHSGYLSSRQLDIWDMMRSGLSQSDVARRLNITRQTVHQLAETIPEKIMAALEDAAKLNGVEARHVDSTKGILFGWSKEFRTETVIALNPEGGLRVWYRHSFGRCDICGDKRRCKSMLLRTTQDLEVSLTPQEKKLDPSRLSDLIFSKIKR